MTHTDRGKETSDNYKTESFSISSAVIISRLKVKEVKEEKK